MLTQWTLPDKEGGCGMKDDPLNELGFEKTPATEWGEEKEEGLTA
jgi:hypothetical protein